MAFDRNRTIFAAVGTSIARGSGVLRQRAYLTVTAVNASLLTDTEPGLALMVQDQALTSVL